MSHKKVQHKQAPTNQVSDIIKTEAPVKKKLRLIRCATGFARLANKEGDIISVSPELEAQLLAEGYAELI